MSRKFDFDDILITPKIKTDIKSRSFIELNEKKLPLLTAPMDTVVNESNYKSFKNLGIQVVLPRTVSPKIKIKDDVFFSVGLYDKNVEDVLCNINHILIDVANGHMFNQIIKTCESYKKINPKIKIMVGNVANPETYKEYALTGIVDYVRIGIGNGNGCLTTKQSGVGYPMASLIHETYNIKKDLHNKNVVGNLPKIVADGGMKDYSDIIKALALGADNVMIGSIFNKCLESAAPNYFWKFKLNNDISKFLYHSGLPITKEFRGMSTKKSQRLLNSNIIKTSEGVVRYRKVEFLLHKWVENFNHYLRTAMSYTNSITLDDFIGNVEIIKISEKSYNRFNK